MKLSLRIIGIILFLITAVTPAPAAGVRDQLVVSTAWLNQHLGDANLILLHVGEKPEYDAKHLPGAQFITLEDIAAPMDRASMKPTDLVLELPTPDALRDRLSAMGISNNSKVVVYYGNDWYSPSTRVIWTLDYAGLGANTVLLDGGMRAWIRDGHPTTADLPKVKKGTLAPLKTTEAVVDAAFMTANARTPGVALVDARDQGFYDGVMPANGRGPGAKTGHIPGALSVPFAQMFDDAGMLLSGERLEAIFTKAGIKPSDTVVAYCHVGQQATAVLFAARTLGHKVRLYDGSMNDWTIRNLPLEVPIKKIGGR